jgi:hypothetical protein
MIISYIDVVVPIGAGLDSVRVGAESWLEAQLGGSIVKMAYRTGISALK